MRSKDSPRNLKTLRNISRHFKNVAASASARAVREAKRADKAEQRGVDAATLANYENQLNDYKKEIDDAKEALKESKNRANEMESLRKLKKGLDDADKEY